MICMGDPPQNGLAPMHLPLRQIQHKLIWAFTSMGTCSQCSCLFPQAAVTLEWISFKFKAVGLVLRRPLMQAFDCTEREQVR